jgi:hypothetical protein
MLIPAARTIAKYEESTISTGLINVRPNKDLFVKSLTVSNSIKRISQLLA